MPLPQFVARTDNGYEVTSTSLIGLALLVGREFFEVPEQHQATWVFMRMGCVCNGMTTIVLVRPE